MRRELYTDGINSAAHVGLGYVGGSALLIPFLAYQYLIKYDRNSTVDTVEYLAGWCLGNMFDWTSYPGLGDDPVSGGQVVSWSGNLASLQNQPGFFDWDEAVQKFISGLRQNGFVVQKVETDPTSGNLSVNAVAPGAFGSAGDVKGLFDGVAKDAGFLFQGIFGNSRIQASAQNLYTPPATNILGAPGGLFTNAVDWWSQVGTQAVGGGGIGIDLPNALGMIPGWVWIAGLAVLFFARGRK